MQEISATKARFNGKPSARATPVGRMNEQRIVESMALLKRSSRVELARVCGLSGATITRAVQKLLDEAILMECGPGQQGKAVGRPTTPLELDSRRPRFGLVQIGPRTTRLAMVPLAIPSEDCWQAEFETGDALDAWVKQVYSAWDVERARRLLSVIVSLPGVVNEDSGQVLLSPNLQWTSQSSFAHGVKVALGHRDVIFIQEIRALALGHLTADSDARDFLLVDAGTGLGAAAVLRGRLSDRGAPAERRDWTHRCARQRPTLRLRIARLPGDACLSRRNVGQRQNEPGARLLERARQVARGKTVAGLDETDVGCGGGGDCRALNILGLREVVLTGSFSELPAPCVEYLEKQIAADAMWARFGKISCRVAPRHRQAGMISRAINSSLFGGSR